MSDTTTAPVVAVAANETPQPAKGTSPMEDTLSRVMGEVSAKYGGGPNEFKSFGEIADKVTKESAAPAKPEAKPAAEPKPEAKEQSPEPEAKPPTKEKLKVGEQEFELDADQVKRFAQKGIYYEKKNADITRRERAVEEREAQSSKSNDQGKAIMEALAKDPGGTLEYLFGDRNKAFEAIKPWAEQVVTKEMEYEQNPHQKMIDEANARAERAERAIREREEAQQKQEIDSQTKTYEEQYVKTILSALEQAGIPKTDFAAAEMAGHMQRALARGIEYTPQQLAQIVREDNTVRIRALTQSLSTGILEANKSGDVDTVVKMGEQAVELLGEPLMFAIAKYHLAKLSKGQPIQPKTIFETPRVPVEGEQPKRRGYMSEDDFAAERRRRAAAIDRGEDVKPW